MQSSLYNDFILTLDNCDIEPIHRPIAIQNHGYMLIFNQKNIDQVAAISNNIPKLFDTSKDQIWTTSIKEWMPFDLFNFWVSINKKDRVSKANYSIVELFGEKFFVIIHFHENNWIIELEPKQNSSYNYLQQILALTNTIKACKSLPELYKTTTTQVKKVIGYDRVMIYKFDEDYHGHVIGEAKEAKLETFLDLHYPATDIPEMARKLFLKNKNRTISDIHASNHQLILRPNQNATVPHFDLTYSELRATSPIHIEYLKNMGVKATFTMSIIHEEKLWGLFACHHYADKLLPYELRKTLELVADTFINRRNAIYQKEQERNLRIYKSFETSFIENINIDDDISAQLVDNQTVLSDLCNADGSSTLGLQNSTFSEGYTPSHKELLLLKNWMLDNNHDALYSTSNFTADVDVSKAFSTIIGGLLSICISKEEESFVFLFRKPQKQKTLWAGNPKAPYEIKELKKTKDILVSPRKSFEKWEAIVEDQSLIWEDVELNMASRLREIIINKEIQKTAKKVELLKKEFMELTYIASHDLQEPLRTLSNYMNLFYKELDGKTNKKTEYYIDRIKLAIDRMSYLIYDLLNYSSIGKNREISEVDTNFVINEIIEDLNDLIESSNANITVTKFPNILGNRVDIKQLFQNLITNALKYVKKDVKPIVEISAKREKNYWIFSVKDNGIGIEPRYFDKVFQMFQRLNNKEEYTGTGIGLSLVKKIVNFYDGKIWIESELDKGTTFFIKIHAIKTTNY